MVEEVPEEENYPELAHEDENYPELAQKPSPQELPQNAWDRIFKRCGPGLGSRVSMKAPHMMTKLLPQFWPFWPKTLFFFEIF